MNRYRIVMAGRHTADEISAGGVVIRRDDNAQWEVCLILARGRWEIPKGHPEPGETPEATALREISEETGLKLDQLHILQPLTPSNYVFQAKGRLVFKRVDTFLIEYSGEGSLIHQASEVDEARWFNFAEAREAAAFKDTKLLLDEALTALKGGAATKV